jgi:purine-cytosine permease-like protein
LTTDTAENPVVPSAPTDEFEREPVPQSRRKGWRSFIGMFAGEHAAGTEFMIGPLFVVHGVSAFDVLVGLLLGNLLAVLSWTFLTAPVATATRITLYYQLEKICGTRLVNIYNLANGLMFCFLAGAMISVSATAVGIPFDMRMPQLNDWLPNSVGWVLAVGAVGVVISVVAARGYEAVARFANVAAPWMVLVFLACGLVSLSYFDVGSLAEFWEVANERIWPGEPLAGNSKFGFWHMVFFAWFANMAMHLGMADMSIFRYAKKWQMGASSFAGMYVGHYMAWIAAAIMYAVQLDIDASNTTVAPGPMTYRTLGLAGAICVIVAGWTTANPTIYRAGLAFQSLLPTWSRTQVTLLAGGLATAGAMFPALVMQLLDFVALYGLVLLPMGTIIIIDHYVFRRAGLLDNLAEKTGIKFNNAAAFTWGATLGLCLLGNIFLGIEIFFLGLPAWFVAALIYVGYSKFYQKQFQRV